MITLFHLALMLSAVSGWSLPPDSDGSAQDSPKTALSLDDGSLVETDGEHLGAVLAHKRRELKWLGKGWSCDEWSVSAPPRPTCPPRLRDLSCRCLLVSARQRHT